MPKILRYGAGTAEPFVDEYKIIDMHVHPGFEKKDIEKRPGCAGAWLSDRRWYMDVRAALGDPDPYCKLNDISEIPDWSVEKWIELMDMHNVSHAVLCGMDTQSEPPANWRWLVPNDYIKKEFLDPYPDRFLAVGGINYGQDTEAAIKQVEDAHDKGFIGIKMFTPHGGYPNDRKKCYPIYERAQQLGLQTHIHTGWENVPGYRIKYCDPMYIDDIATDFPDMIICQLHCGLMINPSTAIMNASHHPNVYTDVSHSFPTRMNLKYFWDFDHFRVLEYYLPDKVFFGTDWPLSLPVYRAMIDNIRFMPLTGEFKRKLFHDNAARVFLGQTD